MYKICKMAARTPIQLLARKRSRRWLVDGRAVRTAPTLSRHSRASPRTRKQCSKNKCTNSSLTNISQIYEKLEFTDSPSRRIRRGMQLHRQLPEFVERRSGRRENLSDLKIHKNNVR